jgi:hypothetical protein
MTETFPERLARIAGDIALGMNCDVRIGQNLDYFDKDGNPDGPYFVQIRCWRLDVITGEEGYGYSGKGQPSKHATDSEIIQLIFGLYLGYWTHEARENFEWAGRRVFGPHIKTQALHSVAKQVDVRSAMHVDDQPQARPNAGLEAWANRYMDERGIEPTPEGQTLADHVARGEA